jgi:GTP-binding protein
MFNKQTLITTAFSLKDLPKRNLPEVILCGRSNVGKSSLINSFFNNSKLAKTSSTPGKTRSINYYLIDDNFYIVDLPGYGYAKTSLKERAYWGNLMFDYLAASKNISFAFQLIDSRHKPTSLDVELKKLLEFHSINYKIILTKADKLNQSELAKAKNGIKDYAPQLSINEDIVLYSTLKSTGSKELANILKMFY